MIATVQKTNRMATRQNAGGVLRCFVPFGTPHYDKKLRAFMPLERGSLFGTPTPQRPQCHPRVPRGEAKIGELFDGFVKLAEVSAGDVIAMPRPGRPEHRQRFDEAGIVFDLRLPGARRRLGENLSASRRRASSCFSMKRPASGKPATR